MRWRSRDHTGVPGVFIPPIQRRTGLGIQKVTIHANARHVHREAVVFGTADDVAAPVLDVAVVFGSTAVPEAGIL